jgi:hypothetical protein
VVPRLPDPLFRLACIAALVTAALLTPAAAPSAAADSPSPTVVGSGDTRSEGEGAGLVGAPVLIALGVIGVGLIVAGGTLVFLRLSRD